MNIILVGASGKMGQTICDLVNNRCNIIAGVDRIKNKKIHQIYENFEKIPQKIIKNCDILLDFAGNSVIKDELLFCKKNKISLVICSTGHTESELNLIKLASNEIPIFMASNTSFGISIISSILKAYLQFFDCYDVSIIEKHHVNKKDAPSGTAIVLKNSLGCFDKKIDIVSVRGGSVVGEHEVLFCGQYEQISIKHVAEDRKLFALGALKICEFMMSVSEAKLYSSDDLFTILKTNNS